MARNEKARGRYGHNNEERGMSTETRRIRINVGATVMQDRRCWAWYATKDGQEIDYDMIFDAEWDGDGWECRADGYGRRSWLGEQGRYGDGRIYVNGRDGVTLLDDAPTAEVTRA